MAKRSAPRKAGKESHAGTQRARASYKASPSKPHAARKPGRGEKPGKEGNAYRIIPGKGNSEGSQSKNGCFPKLLMLALPFIAMGVNFIR